MSGKIVLNNAVFFVLVILSAAMGIYSVRVVTGNLTALYVQNYPAISLLLNIDCDLQQSLVAERTMLTTRDPEELKVLDETRLTNLQQATDRWNQYKALPRSAAQEKTAIPRYEKAVAAWAAVSDRVAALAKDGTAYSLVQAQTLSAGDGNDKFEAARGFIDEIRNRNEESTLAVHAASKRVEGNSSVWQICLSVFTLLAGLGAAWVMSKQIAGPARRLGAALKDIAQGEGDLTVRLDAGSKDEMGEVARWFNVFMERIHNVVQAMVDTANQVASTSSSLSKGAEESTRVTEQIAETMQQIAAASQNQSASASRTAVAVDQLNTAIANVAQATETQTDGLRESLDAADKADRSLESATDLLQQTGTAAKQNAQYAARGTKSVANVMQSMRSIKSTTANVAERIRELDGYSQEIGKIIEVINGIAAQTNLLALNAAIEAARAGEYGKGFAVVSEEVRKLSEDSSRETKAIAALVDSIRQAIGKAVGAADAGTKEVETGSLLAQEASASLAEIAQGAAQTERMVVELFDSTRATAEANATVQESMRRIAALAEETSASTAEMTGGANEVRNLIDSVAAVSEESAASTEEVSASSMEMSASLQEVYRSAQSLAELAERLRNVIGKFRT